MGNGLAGLEQGHMELRVSKNVAWDKPLRMIPSNMVNSVDVGDLDLES